MIADAPHSGPRAGQELAWACRVLGLAAGVSSPPAQAAALAQLEQVHFVPPARLEQAVLLLADQLPDTLWARDRGGAMVRDGERVLGPAVDRLAREFFALEPAQRRAVWQVLKEQATFSIPLSTRLEALAAGLDVTVPALDRERQSLPDQLAQGIVEAFVMLPSARAAWHEECLQRALAAPRHWQPAARDFRRRFRPLEPLAPELLASLCQARRLSRATEKKARAAEKKLRKASARQTPKARKTSPSAWAVYLVLFLLFRVLSTAFHTDSTSPPTTPSLSQYRTPYSNSSRSRPSDDPLLHEMPAAIGRGVLPAPGPGYAGEEVRLGEAARRMFNLPDDVDLFREDGHYVLRHRAAPPSSRAPETIRLPVLSEEGPAHD